MQASNLALVNSIAPDLPRGAWRYPSLDAFVFAGCGLALLFIGTWVPNPRLNFNGVPVDSVVLAAVTLMVTLGSVRYDTLRSLSILQIPLLLLGLTILWSPLPALGLENLSSLVLMSFLTFLLFNTVIERHGEMELARVLLIFLAIDLAAAVAYKTLFGFFDRDVLFFLNGPIVFGRFMSVALILSLYAYRGLLRVIAAAAFYVAIIWTESKGPILAATLTVLALLWLSSSRRGKIALLLAGVSIAACFIAAANYFDISARTIGRLAVLLNALSGDTTLPVLIAGESARTTAWGQTIQLIFERPMGVGLGGWTQYVKTPSSIPYPHNLFLELWSEGGVVLGTLACVPLLLFLVVRKSMFWFVAMCLLMAQMVSGNISDARQMYVFALLALLRRIPIKTNGSVAVT